jgi:hypothetical protein
MKILSYEAYSGLKKDLHFSKINFGKLNLIVGASATGKTRLLNTIFNGALMAVQAQPLYIGSWDFTVEIQGQVYQWKLLTGEGKDDEIRILKESIVMKEENGNDTILVERNLDSFFYQGKELPKLAADKSSIYLLKDEGPINPLYLGFSSIIRRRFHSGELENASSLQSVPQQLMVKIKKTKELNDLFTAGLQLNPRLYILSQYFKDIYKIICREFKTVFPFVTELDVRMAEEFGFQYPGIVPVFAMKENFVQNNWIPLNDFSSGMQKVLLILTDLFTLPPHGGIYLIDEYENSLGLNAINFFPGVLLEADTDNQFIITSHHPYIIGNVPVKNWVILHRKGQEIMAKEGSELDKKFSKSKQQAFIQLINDSFYTEGIE